MKTTAQAFEKIFEGKNIPKIKNENILLLLKTTTTTLFNNDVNIRIKEFFPCSININKTIHFLSLFIYICLNIIKKTIIFNIFIIIILVNDLSCMGKALQKKKNKGSFKFNKHSEFSKKDIIIFSFNEFVENNHSNIELDRELLSASIGLGKKTFNVYLSEIYSEKYINKIKTCHNTEKQKIVIYNCKGREKISELINKLDNLYFFPGRHETEKIIKFTDIYYSLSNPYDRIFLLSIYNEQYCFNLPILLKYFDISNNNIIYNTVYSTSFLNKFLNSPTPD